MKETVHNNAAANIHVALDNATNLKNFAASSVNKIVTDPPWGHYQSSINPIKLYQAFLKEAARVLAKDGLLIMLVSKEANLKPILPPNLKIVEKLDILLAGNKASVYLLKKE